MITLNVKKVGITLFWLLTIAVYVYSAVNVAEFLATHEFVGFQTKLISPLASINQ